MEDDGFADKFAYISDNIKKKQQKKLLQNSSQFVEFLFLRDTRKLLCFVLMI